MIYIYVYYIYIYIYMKLSTCVFGSTTKWMHHLYYIEMQGEKAERGRH